MSRARRSGSWRRRTADCRPPITAVAKLSGHASTVWFFAHSSAQGCEWGTLDSDQELHLTLSGVQAVAQAAALRCRIELYLRVGARLWSGRAGLGDWA
jgi:hypothetical protein